MRHALAVDIGATKFAAGVVDEDGALLCSAKVDVAGLADAEEAWARLVTAIGSLDASVVLDVCGVGTAGPAAPHAALVSPLNLTAWRDFPLRARLEELTGLPVFGDLDAKALALGEGWRGAARGQDHFIAMVVSTGIGGGIVLDGRLLDGASGNAGHVGHVVVDPDGPPCACGGCGCVEAMASGPSIKRIYGVEPAEATPDIIERTGRLVGRAVASVINLLDLPLAVVAGSVALGFGAPFFEAAQREIELRSRLSFARGARIVPGGLGEDGPLIGAARVGFLGLG